MRRKNLSRLAAACSLLAGAALFALSGPTATFAEVVIGRTFLVGHAPIGIDIDEARNQVWVANYNDGPDEGGSFSIVDVASAATRTFPVNRPQGIIFNDVTGKAYISGGDDDVTVVHRDTPDSQKVLQVGSIPKFLSVNKQTNRIYVANYGGQSISIINGDTDEVEDTMSVPGMSMVGTYVDETINRLYAIGFTEVDSQLLFIDPNSKSIQRRIHLGGEIWDITVDQSTGHIYIVGNDGPGYIASYDRDGNLRGRKTLGSRSTGVAFNPITKNIYAVNEYGEPDDQHDMTMMVLDTDLNIKQSIYFGYIVGIGIAVDETRSKGYIGNLYSRAWGEPVIWEFFDNEGSVTATPTATPTATSTPTATATSTPTNTPTNTPTPTATATPFTFDVDAGSRTIMPTSDGLTFEFPSNLYSETVRMRYQPQGQPATVPEGLVPTERYWTLEVLDPDTGQPLTAPPTTPYTVTVGMTPEQLGVVISTTQQLFQRTGAGNWTTSGISQQPISQTGQVVAQTNGFSLFGIFGQTNRVFVPMVGRGTTAGW